MTAFDKAWNSITKAEMSCPFCGEPFDIYDIRDFDDSPGIEAFRKYGCGAFKTPQKECKSDPINKAWDVVKSDSCLTCGKKIDSPDELDHHHGHTFDSLSGPYCDQDCWVAGEKYNPHGGSK